MARVCIAAGKLERSSATPAIGQNIAQVIADGEAKLGHAVVILRAPVAGTVALVLVRDLERVDIDALGEVQESLEMGAARGAREAVLVGLNVVVLAEPRHLRIGGRLVGCRGRGRSSQHHEVLGNGNLGLALAQVVVGGESEQWDVVICFAIIGSVDKRGDP